MWTLSQHCPQQQLQIHIQLPLHCRVHRYRCITSYSPAPCTSLLEHFSLSNRIVHTFYSDVDIITALSQQQLQIHIQLPLHCRVHRYRCITSYSPAPCTSLLEHFSLSNRIVHTFYSDSAPIPLYNIVQSCTVYVPVGTFQLVRQDFSHFLLRCEHYHSTVSNNNCRYTSNYRYIVECTDTVV
ncbi:hypothetical protein J6590_043199 [Homalodisca vitripennis]|nr:hypothetical protein J6590_043199 [Homalodisca vitripennis]